jgi:hypothetical protein
MEKAVLVEFSVELLIKSSVLQPTAHGFLHIYIYIYIYIYIFQISPTCLGVLYTIFRDNFVYLLKTLVSLKGCYMYYKV